MRLTDFLDPAAVSLTLSAPSRDGVLEEMVGLLRLDPRTSGALVQLLRRREELGATAFGRGIAIPHARSLALTRLRVAFGYHRQGVDFQAADGHLVHAIFLIVAPPHEVSNQYLPVLGRIAQLCQQPDLPDRLRLLETPAEFLQLVAARGA